MTEHVIPETDRTPRGRTVGFRVGALGVLALAAGVILWLALRDTGGSSTSESNATAVSIDQIANLATSVDHPVFWVGPRGGFTYELTRSSNGAIFIRYLPPGADLGTNQPYLTVATYPFAGAFPALQAVAKQSGSTPVKLSNGGLAVLSSTNPASVHVAYPRVDYQVEVYDPAPRRAIAAARHLAAFGSLATGPAALPSKPVAASVPDLQSLARTLKQPVYWVGPRAGYTYELTKTPSGKVYIRYLPRGVRVGAAQPYLTVATYPFPGAFASLQTLSKEKNQVTIKLAGRGIALVSTQYPKSIHLAYPGSDYEIEVFDPAAARVRQIVSSNQVKTIG
jgi:hypothetical protein